MLPDFKIYYRATVIKAYHTNIKWRYRTVKQNRQPRDKPIHTRPKDLQQGYKDNIMRKG